MLNCAPNKLFLAHKKLEKHPKTSVYVSLKSVFMIIWNCIALLNVIVRTLICLHIHKNGFNAYITFSYRHIREKNNQKSFKRNLFPWLLITEKYDRAVVPRVQEHVWENLKIKNWCHTVVTRYEIRCYLLCFYLLICEFVIERIMNGRVRFSQYSV